MKTKYKVLVEFVSVDGLFHSMYHYLSIDDALNDLLYGDLRSFVNDPYIDITISKGNFESFWNNFEN